MTNKHEIKMMTPTTKALIVVLIFGLILAVYRMLFGLGAATNLNDLWPWGFWIGMDVLGGVAMASGGFVIAGAVYILNWKKYKPIVRPAILNAFFGYLLAALAIFLDIGQSFRIWHPIVMWQVNSIMFIVAIHVVLYTTTLAIESSPMIFERFGMKRALSIINKVMVPVVLFGVLLSTLHQSSLGAVYLILPTKLSPLWYTSLLPYMFLISAVFLALNMVSFETILSERFLKHKAPRDILYGLAKGSLIVGGIYFIMKAYQLLSGPGIQAAFAGTLTSNMYLLEMIIGLVIPLMLLSMKKMRERINSLLAINILVIIGVVLNRLNVAIFGLSEYTSRAGADYFPSWMEFGVTAGFIAFAILGFKVCAKYLNLFPETQH